MKNNILILLLILSIVACNNSKKNNANTKQKIKHLEEQATNPDTEKKFEELINSGCDYLQKNQLEEAIKVFEKAIALDASKPDGYYGLGVAKAILCHQNRIYCNEAIENLETALSIVPNFRKTLFNIGTCYISLGQFNKGIKYLDEAISNDMTNGEYYLNRGFAKLQLNDMAGACEDFQMALNYGVEKAKQYISENCK